MLGGLVPDSALALDVILARLYECNGKLPIPHFYDAVRSLTDKERRALRALHKDGASLPQDVGLLPGVSFAGEPDLHPYEQIWRRPAIAVIAQEASSIKGASNQILPTAAAIVSCRIVPDQDPTEVFARLRDFLTENPPWGVQVTVKLYESPVKWWMTDPAGPAFGAAFSALREGFGREPVSVGCGGSIGFVGPLAELFGGAPALLLGIEDPHSNAHAPNESLHEGDWTKLIASLAQLFENLGRLRSARVK